MIIYLPPTQQNATEPATMRLLLRLLPHEMGDKPDAHDLVSHDQSDNESYYEDLPPVRFHRAVLFSEPPAHRPPSSTTSRRSQGLTLQRCGLPSRRTPAFDILHHRRSRTGCWGHFLRKSSASCSSTSRRVGRAYPWPPVVKRDTDSAPMRAIAPIWPAVSRPGGVGRPSNSSI